MTRAPGGALAPGTAKPGRRGVFATVRLPLAVLAGSVAAVLLPGPPWLDLLGVNALLACLLVVDVVRAPRPDSLQAARQAPDVVALGHPGHSELRLHNPTRRRLWIATHDGAVASLGLRPARQVATLDPDVWVTMDEEIRPVRRGHASIGPLTVRTRGPLGLGGRQQTLPLVHPIRCYPALPGRRQVELRLDRARLLQSGLRSTAIRGGAGEFDALREYHPDDEFRRINWRATARGSKTISNTYREERNQQIFLLVDASRMMAGTVAGAPRFEYTLDAGIALAELAGRVGDHVGMAAFAGDVLTFTGPRGGRTQARRILDHLFDLEPNLEGPNYRLAFSVVLARHRRRALLVLLTELTDTAAMEGLFASLAVLLSRHLVIVATVRDPAVESEATRIPATSEEAYRKAAAVGALEARSIAAARLASMGATVVDRLPGDLAGALADQYLRIKSQGKL